MKLLLMTLMMFASINIISQNNAQYVIKKCLNDKSFQASEGVICSDEMKMKWFMMLPNFKSEKDQPIPSGLSVVKSGIGSCSKNDLLVITFDDHSRIILRSANYDLLCDTWIQFLVNPSDMNLLQMKQIDTIRYVNGNELKSFTYYMKTEKEKRFFINVYTNSVIVLDCCSSK